MKIGSYTYDEYLEAVRRFHGTVAPGVVLGGFMVNLVLDNLPKGEFFDALCETRACLPDAVQLLTPCTTGNGWLKVIDLGRYALALYDKSSGRGVRVYVDASKMEEWPELKSWYFKLKPKKQQDFALLLEEIKTAGAGVCSLQNVQLDPDFIKVRRRKGFKICAVCGEAYSVTDGPICRGCQGEAPYVAMEASLLETPAFSCPGKCHAL